MSQIIVFLMAMPIDCRPCALCSFAQVHVQSSMSVKIINILAYTSTRCCSGQCSMQRVQGTCTCMCSRDLYSYVIVTDRVCISTMSWEVLVKECSWQFIMTSDVSVELQCTCIGPCCYRPTHVIAIYFVHRKSVKKQRRKRWSANASRTSEQSVFNEIRAICMQKMS